MEHGTAPAGEVFNFGLLHLEWTTALFVFAVFVTTAYLLNRLLFKPILRTLEARREKLDRNENEVERLRSAVESSEKEIEKRLSDIAGNMRTARAEALTSAKKDAARIVEQVKASASERLEAGEREIAESRRQAMDRVAGLAENLAQLIRTKLLA